MHLYTEPIFYWSQLVTQLKCLILLAFRLSEVVTKVVTRWSQVVTGGHRQSEQPGTSFHRLPEHVPDAPPVFCKADAKLANPNGFQLLTDPGSQCTGFGITLTTHLCKQGNELQFRSLLTMSLMRALHLSVKSLLLLDRGLSSFRKSEKHTPAFLNPYTICCILASGIPENAHWERIRWAK